MARSLGYRLKKSKMFSTYTIQSPCYFNSYFVNSKSVIFIFVLLIMMSCGTKKELPAKEVSTADFDIKVMSNLVEVDNLSRIYLVDQWNNIINYKPDLKEQYKYANKRSGKVSSIDVNNPLRVVVFYDDFNQVKLLDNTLSVISELNLNDKFADITACGTSNDGNLWVFDPVQFKLLKIKDNGEVLLQTSNVNDFGMRYTEISEIRERGNFVVLCDRNNGFYIFDNLGQYMYTYETKDILSFQFDGRNIYYYTSTGLKSYSIKFKERLMLSYPLEMNKTGLKYVLFNSGDLYEINENGINVVKKPSTTN